MQTRSILIIAGVVGVLLLGAAGWYLGSPLIIDNTVDEAFPFDLPEAADLETMSSAEMAELEGAFMDALPNDAVIAALDDGDRAAVEARVMAAAAAVMADDVMAEAMPAAGEWQLVTQGTFSGTDALHQGQGTASVFQLGDQRVLRFEDFEVTNGPDLHVILSTNPNPTGQDDLGDYIDLGQLKGNVGNQNYELPADLDLSLYQSVIIYCVPFHVLFAVAPLS